MEVLSSRTLLYPADFDATVRFYDDAVGLTRYREYGVDGRVTGVVWFLGGGYLEASSHPPEGVGGGADGAPLRLWWQVADVDEAHLRLAAAGVPVVAPPATMPWGLREAWITDPDGVRICLAEVPDDHPLRRRV